MSENVKSVQFLHHAPRCVSDSASVRRSSPTRWLWRSRVSECWTSDWPHRHEREAWWRSNSGEQIRAPVGPFNKSGACQSWWCPPTARAAAGRMVSHHSFWQHVTNSSRTALHVPQRVYICCWVVVGFFPLFLWMKTSCCHTHHTQVLWGQPRVSDTLQTLDEIEKNSTWTALTLTWRLRLFQQSCRLCISFWPLYWLEMTQACVVFRISEHVH